jgi:ubiquinol-cytochrome c reductase cytochrome c1 subunit
MIKKLVVTALSAFLAVTGSAGAAERVEVPRQEWGFEGFFGTFDRATLQRGFQVYQSACQSCHSLDFIAFRHLQDIGLGPEQIEAVAGGYEVEDGPDEVGEMFMRPARAADYIPPPFPNEMAARAANAGALPPDLSLIVRGRPNGINYVYALMTGYAEEPPEDVELGPGMYYNAYFPGHQIAMPPPLLEGVVEYADGTEETVEQYARDITTFLTWTAYPEMEERKRLGVKVILFLIGFTALLFALKKKIWSDVH